MSNTKTQRTTAYMNFKGLVIMYVHTFMLYSTKLSRTVVLKQITISFQEPTNDPIYAEKTHFISLMRATHFSVSLSVLPTRSSKWLNINGQHGCSNTELYLCSSISTAQSRNLCTACSDSISAAKCYKRTFQTTSTLISTNAGWSHSFSACSETLLISVCI